MITVEKANQYIKAKGYEALPTGFAVYSDPDIPMCLLIANYPNHILPLFSISRRTGRAS